MSRGTLALDWLHVAFPVGAPERDQSKLGDFMLECLRRRLSDG